MPGQKGKTGARKNEITYSAGPKLPVTAAAVDGTRPLMAKREWKMGWSQRNGKEDGKEETADNESAAACWPFKERRNLWSGKPRAFSREPMDGRHPNPPRLGNGQRRPRTAGRKLMKKSEAAASSALPLMSWGNKGWIWIGKWGRQ